MTDNLPSDPREAIRAILSDLAIDKFIDIDEAEEAIWAALIRDVDPGRLIDTVAVDISRGRSGNMSDRQTAAMLFKIPELAWGLEALREKNARERAMRTG